MKKSEIDEKKSTPYKLRKLIRDLASELYHSLRMKNFFINQEKEIQLRLNSLFIKNNLTYEKLKFENNNGDIINLEVILDENRIGRRIDPEKFRKEVGDEIFYQCIYVNQEKAKLLAKDVNFDKLLIKEKRPPKVYVKPIK